MYRFKLEALLNYRRHQEEACQKELAQARRRLTDEREKLERKKKEKQESLEKLQVKKKVSTTVSDIMLYMNYIQQLSKDIEDQAMLVHKTAKLVDQKRHELVSSMQKHKTLKNLKYKEQQAYQQKLMQDERKLMDEIASIRHARKM
ncbi:MAG: flagellar export protein FliJ [Deltaproteobacteria bacterium]|jgi:flagellar FliJ protein|nr:flagellar export protein FliJ [Deltaproteobacteria bacterium]